MEPVLAVVCFAEVGPGCWRLRLGGGSHDAKGVLGGGWHISDAGRFRMSASPLASAKQDAQ